MIVIRQTALKLSAPPASARSSSATQRLRANPNATMATPQTVIDIDDDPAEPLGSSGRPADQRGDHCAESRGGVEEVRAPARRRGTCLRRAPGTPRAASRRSSPRGPSRTCRAGSAGGGRTSMPTKDRRDWPLPLRRRVSLRRQHDHRDQRGAEGDDVHRVRLREAEMRDDEAADRRPRDERRLEQHDVERERARKLIDCRRGSG